MLTNVSWSDAGVRLVDGNLMPPEFLSNYLKGSMPQGVYNVYLNIRPPSPPNPLTA